MSPMWSWSAGGAGASAAIEAREQGAEVLVIDRFSGGGASVLSGGVVYAGGGTRYQKEAGFEDSPEAMTAYLRHEVNGVVSDATLARFSRESVANLQWLEKQGARFDSTMPAYKTSYPPDGVYLYYSGNEVVPAYGSPALAEALRAVTVSWPRGNLALLSLQRSSSPRWPMVPVR